VKGRRRKDLLDKSKRRIKESERRDKVVGKKEGELEQRESPTCPTSIVEPRDNSPRWEVWGTDYSRIYYAGHMVVLWINWLW
jgi:hypothetical protein